MCEENVVERGARHIGELHLVPEGRRKSDPMITVLLDGNVFDKIAEDAEGRAMLRALCSSGRLRQVTSPTVRGEVAASRKPGLLALLDEMPIEVVGNAPPLADLMRAGDHLGDPQRFVEHKGKSSKVDDALIAAAADFHSDYVVSGDDRLRHRVEGWRVKSLDYEGLIKVAGDLR